MSKDTQNRIAELIGHDHESSVIAWDKGTPRYIVKCEAKTFYVKNLREWCDFYEINYQMLARVVREGQGTYKGCEVTKL